MTHPSVEELFRRFQATGDPRALASVYDRVAPDLLLLAVHLGQREGDAEDLLQATFLAAIEGARQFDPNRALLPWLMGILANQARRQWRERRRQPDVDRLAAALRPVPDPAEEAEITEFAEEFERRLAALPPGYREVLTLRWVHDLTPTQIAHSLGVPVETVKTRLKRGNDLLRRALPAGFAAATLVALSPARDLASIRAVVLARAEELRRTSGAATGAWSAASKPAAVAAAAAMAIVVAGLAILWNRYESPAAPASRGQPTAADREPAPSDATSGLETARSPITPADVLPAVPRRLRVLLADGSPAAGAVVSLRRDGDPDPLLRETWRAADVNGEIRCGDLSPGLWNCAALRADARMTLALAEDGPADGELRLARGLDLAGTVRDGDTPIPGAGIWLSREGHFDEGHLATVTDETGRFALRDVAPGRAFSVLVDGFLPRPLQQLEGDAGDRVELDVDLASLRSGWSIAGRVVDASGTPVPSALVQLGRRLPHLDFDDEAMGEEARVPPLVLRTDADGRFAHCGFLVFYRAIDLWARAPGHAPAAQRVVFPPDVRHRDVEIRLSAGRRVTGRVSVVEGELPAPVRVEAHAPAAEGSDPKFAPRWVAVVAVADAAGSFVLDGVPDGPVHLVAAAPDGRRAMVRRNETGELWWDAVLREPSSITGFLVDPRGTPIEGLQVRGLVGEGRQEPLAVRSDVHGEFVLADCDADAHTLWVTDPASPWTGRVAAMPGVLAEHSPVTVTVPDHVRSTAALAGRAVDEEGEPIPNADVALGNLRVGRTYVTCDGAGRFRIEPLPALPDWDLYLRDANGLWAGVGGVTTRPHETTDLGDVRLGRTGRLRVRVLGPDGVPPAEPARARLVAADGLVCDEIAVQNGEGRSAAQPTGDYRLFFAGPALPLTPTDVRIEAGRDAVVDLRAASGAVVRLHFAHPDDGWDLRLELTWRDQTGRMLGTDRLQLPRGHPFVFEQRLAPGRYRLDARAHSGRLASLDLTVDRAAAGPIPVEVPLR